MEKRKPFETFAHYTVGKGHVTLSIAVDEGEAQVGVVFCHPRDCFDKSFGRNVALGRRLKQSNYFSFGFTRNDQRLTAQVRSEFEQYVALSASARQAQNTGVNVDWVGAPPWAIHSLSRELRKRGRATESVSNE